MDSSNIGLIGVGLLGSAIAERLLGQYQDQKQLEEQEDEHEANEGEEHEVSPEYPQDEEETELMPCYLAYNVVTVDFQLKIGGYEKNTWLYC